MATFPKVNMGSLYDAAFASIQNAKQKRQGGELQLALDEYMTGIATFMQIVKMESNSKKRDTVKRHLSTFIKEAETLKQQVQAQPSAPPLDILDLPDPPSFNIDLPDPPASAPMPKYSNEGGNDLDIFVRAQSVLDEAIDLDQQKQHSDAISKYKNAATLFLDGLKMNESLISKEEKTKYREKVSTMVGRCELLTALIEKQKKEAATRVNSGVANESLSQKEIRVLRSSSFIRNLELMPWIPADCTSIRVDDEDSDMFKDPTGLLPLSEKQKSKFGKWKRIRNIASKGKPQIVSLVTPYSITQTLISDCSFVSSITVTALYEKIFRKKLITSIIYPQSAGNPIYNPKGKYAVKLHINGCARKVEIDDYLPVSASGKLLCSFSNNPNEFWVSLIEKAFLKVMGGYDFPGSTSAEDLSVLTGWIPERIGFKDAKAQFNVEREFDRLVSGAKFGDCLITLSSRKMSDEEADQLGLVPSHAYAVLRVEKLGNHKFMLIKNPWASKRWKGRFSANDDKNWTPQLRKALNYNPNREKQFDNGIFWMNFEDVRQHFSAVFLNWNPDLFAFKITQHGFWSKKVGPKNDSHNLGYNPQFTLDVDLSQSPSERKENDESRVGGSVWVLLSKHMENSKREEQDKHDFLTIHCYDENTVNTRDRRVFHRGDALYTGTYIDSPHYLMRIDVEDVEKKLKTRRFTIVISQYEKVHDVSFSITAYSTLPARFRPIDDQRLWRYQKVFPGRWDKKYCGGSPNHDSFPKNPQFKITTYHKSHLRFLLEAPIKFGVNIQLYLCVNDEGNDDGVSSYDHENVDLEQEVVYDEDVNAGKIVNKKHYSRDLLIGDSGPYRKGVCMVDVMNVEVGTYIAIISTFQPKQMGGFKFTIKSVENLSIGVV